MAVSHPLCPDFIKNNEVPFLQDPSLTDYFPLLHPSVVNVILSSAWASVAVFRDLDPYAQMIVTRLLYINSPVPKALVSSWFQKTSDTFETASNLLLSLSILKEELLPGGLCGLLLRPHVQRSLRVALLGGSSSLESLIPCTQEDPKAKDTKFIDDYAAQRWDCVIQYIVNHNFNSGISKATLITLLSAKLMAVCDQDKPKITNLGIQFLLSNTRAQLWFFILNYLIKHCASTVTFSMCLRLLLQIAQSTPGRFYTTEGFAVSQLAFLQDLREFGLVYQRTRKDGKFYPTKYAFCLLDRSINLCPPICFGNFIIETSFRVYAYSDAPYLLYLLSLFSELLYRLPSMTVAVVTRESYREAIKNGVKTEQIIDFLKTRLHPVMKGNIPDVIVDQFFLWEKETRRVNGVLSVLYHMIHSDSDFAELKAYAEQHEVLIWSCEKSRKLAVTDAGHWKMKKYWKHHVRGK